jgi:hypothetical protein
MNRALLLYAALATSALAQPLPAMRPPAVPLIAHDPYFSVWSFNDKLTDGPTRHWTGTEQALAGYVRIDGKPFRFLGNQPREAEAMEQRALRVTPTRTAYEFRAGGVDLTLTFLTPALPHDLDVMSRPLTYVLFDARSIDANEHDVTIYFDVPAALAQNVADQRTHWSRAQVDDMVVLRAGTNEQNVLGKAGDNLRIDWGFVYLALPKQDGAAAIVVNQRQRAAIAMKGEWPAADDLELTSAAARYQTVLASRFELGKVGTKMVSSRAMVAYDDVWSIQYFQRNLRPWWRRDGMKAADMLRAAARDFDSLSARCARFDEELTADLIKAGGSEYAQIAILAYRQTLAAHKLVADLDGTPLYFSKENFSNGCIGTVDVTYPSAPFFLLLQPQLLKAQIRPILDYASLPRWRFPFAPHDLGTYPLANGQVYGGGELTEENQMPVEESGNMLILAAALAQAEGNADFSGRFWPVLTKWAEYLKAKGMDPDNQLSTDDFAGHLARNTNLSLKAIVALGSYAKLARALGKADVAKQYESIAKEMAAKWIQMADDGDHYRLTFDRAGTWSQKYNLVWDRILGLGLFPNTVASKELAYYKGKQNRYGLPLDSRETYTKLDWIVWTATLAESEADFRTLTSPILRCLNESPSRVPMTDWYDTVSGKQSGFQARSVVGGVYIKLLADPAVWRRWSSKQ